MILKVACKQNLQKRPFGHPKLAEKMPCWRSLVQVKICKIHRNNLYFCFLGALRYAFRVPSTVPFVLILLNTRFSTDFSAFFGKVLPALIGKHDFQSCMCAKSSKMTSKRDPLLEPKSAKIAQKVRLESNRKNTCKKLAKIMQNRRPNTSRNKHFA